MTKTIRPLTKPRHETTRSDPSQASAARSKSSMAPLCKAEAIIYDEEIELCDDEEEDNVEIGSSQPDNTDIPIKALVKEVVSRFGYTVTYRKTCIEGFAYCKHILQVDGTLFTDKYTGLLEASSQYGNMRIFLVVFAIVEGETKEV
ncbi:hypothetical protein Lal_00013909 [Lupinus albus]|nr:hypothetical protein Lal_00013909 [Lupinus albus]